MPELPEVETTVRSIRPGLVGRRITRFITRWAKNAHPNPKTVRTGVVGRIIRRVDRRAKFVIIELNDGGHLLIHLRMSGRLEWSAANAPQSHVRAWWDFDDGGRLLFCDARKFGRIRYTRDLAAATAALGVEPLSPAFTVERLAELLRSRSRMLKPLLLDQSAVAGLGNIYTDEALFHAGIHPRRSAQSLRQEEIGRLHGAIRNVLKQGIRQNGASIDWVWPQGRMQDYFAVYSRAGEPCIRCRTPIVAMRIGQRGTHFCPACQMQQPTSHVHAAVDVDHMPGDVRGVWR